MQRAVWDLAWEGATKIKGGKIDTGDPAAGPRAVPGTYTVRLTVDGKTLTSPLKSWRIRRTRRSQADLEAQLAFGLRVRDDISKLTGAGQQLRSVRDQLQARVKALDTRKAEAPVATLLDVVAGGRQEDRRARGQAPQPDSRSRLRHPGDARRHEALLPAGAAADVVDRSRGAADGRHDPGARSTGEGARRARSPKPARLVAGEIASVNAQAAKLGLAFVIVP